MEVTVVKGKLPSPTTLSVAPFTSSTRRSIQQQLVSKGERRESASRQEEVIRAVSASECEMFSRCSSVNKSHLLF